ncbi:hypothetical protein [uncultured Roseobacter sp.]|uniref:hypothetical protein n=1 Tax=uncultured Roseobacter sp. TaxID=114847 RepID=UPI002626D3FA|nr:hypothetical protein [uncultured Roseobacter sp.]
MSKLAVLRTGLVVWVFWHAAFALLATFAPEAGGSLVGWTPDGGWTAELRAMSKQYGMSMLLIGLIFGIMLLNPIRYLSFIWIAIAEQAFGIAYGFYIYAALGQLTTLQLIMQAVVNAALIVGMLILWFGLQKPLSLARGEIG